MPPSNTTCPVDGCDEPTPWDMAAVNFDGQYFCSPECARSHLDGMERAPSDMTLHDPQFHTDRDAFPDVPDDAVDIHRSVTGRDDARTAIDEIAEMHPGEFRVS